MKTTLIILAMLLSGCAGLTVGIAYTPPITVGVTFAYNPPPTPPVTPPTTQVKP